MCFDLFCYDQYEYAGNPLAFVVLPAHKTVTDDQKLRLVRLVDELYANTAQETSDWALEFQLWTRMILCDSAVSLPINTFAHHLYLDKDDIELICDILCPDSENANAFRTCCGSAALHSFCKDLIKADPDLNEGFSVLIAMDISVQLVDPNPPKGTKGEAGEQNV